MILSEDIKCFRRKTLIFRQTWSFSTVGILKSQCCSQMSRIRCFDRSAATHSSSSSLPSYFLLLLFPSSIVPRAVQSWHPLNWPASSCECWASRLALPVRKARRNPGRPPCDGVHGARHSSAPPGPPCDGVHCARQPYTPPAPPCDRVHAIAPLTPFRRSARECYWAESTQKLRPANLPCNGVHVIATPAGGRSTMRWQGPHSSLFLLSEDGKLCIAGPSGSLAR